MDARDDLLYLPAIRQAQICLNPRGLTHSGDSKMGALDTRVHWTKRRLLIRSAR